MLKNSCSLKKEYFYSIDFECLGRPCFEECCTYSATWHTENSCKGSFEILIPLKNEVKRMFLHCWEVSSNIFIGYARHFKQIIKTSCFFLLQKRFPFSLNFFFISNAWKKFIVYSWIIFIGKQINCCLQLLFRENILWANNLQSHFIFAHWILFNAKYHTSYFSLFKPLVVIQ